MIQITDGLTEKFQGGLKDERRYVIFSLDRKDVCPLVTGAGAICKSDDHMHEVVTRVGYDNACEYVSRKRSDGWEVKLMDRTN